METMENVFEFIILVAVLLTLIRNIRKDRSDGRDMLGGGGGVGREERGDTHLK